MHQSNPRKVEVKATGQWRIQAVSALPGNPPSRTKGVGPGTL